MRRGQQPRHAIRTIAVAALLAVAGLAPRDAHAVRAPAESRADIKRFGLDQFSRPRRRNPSAKSRSAFEPFNKAHGGRWKIRFDGRTGLPSALVEGASTPHPGTPQEAAAAFLAEQRDLLGVDPTTLSVERVTSQPGHSHVLYRQTYLGLPVEFARVKVHLDGRGAVTGVHSSFEPDLAMGVTPSVTAAQAAATVRQDSGAVPSSRGALVIFPDKNSGQARLAWKFTARTKTALWRYYIDAQTGALLLRYNDLRFIGSCNGIGGNVSGWVYDIDPTQTPGPVQRPFAHQAVYVGNGTNVSTTDVSGNYCAAFAYPEVMFTQLQGPYVNVSNFHGPSAQYDNGVGSAWYTMSTPVSSPHPYPSDSVLISTVNIPANVSGHAVAKVLPIFSDLNVGFVASAGATGGEGGDITDDSEISILDPNGHPVAGYVGKLGAFNGTAVPAATPVNTYRIQLKSTSLAGGGYGFDILLSSYLVLGAAPAGGPGDPSYSLIWSTANTAAFSPVDAGVPAGSPMASEISLFYQLNRQHDFFTSGPDGSTLPPPYRTPAYSPGVDGSAAADIISRPVNVLALMGPDIGDPFYDPDNDNLNFGDMYDAAPSDILTLDATVPHHEYTHYVVQKIWNIQNMDQAGAISEGNADYFSATSLNDSSIGAYYNGGPALRELDWQKQGATVCSPMPGSLCQVLCPTANSVNCNSGWQGEIHSDSIFFSQSLWDIRRALMSADATHGQACADGLAFQTLLFFPESFQEYVDDMLLAVGGGAVPACGQGNLSTYSIAPLITGSFQTHGLPLGAGVDAQHTGFESALDVSTYTSVTGYINAAGVTDFYTFGSGAGPISITMKLPVHGLPPHGDGYYNGYSLTLYDLYHNTVATAPASFLSCDESDCESPSATVFLTYYNPTAGQMFLQVAGGYNESGVNSQLPYTLTITYPHSGALVGSVVQASYNNDAIAFSVLVTTWPQRQDYSFAYAQLRDQSQDVLNNTQTDSPGGFLEWVSSYNALGTITGQANLQPSSLGGATCAACKTVPCTFSQCYPSVGTVYLEVFGYDVTGSTVSLGLSNPINLTTNNAATLTAYNNIFNPNLGQKATVKYEVQSAGHVTIKLFSLSGTLVSTLLDGYVPAGEGSVDWFGSNSAGNRVASGVYVVHMSGPGGVNQTQKIVVVK
jgi:hypothetical protein